MNQAKEFWKSIVEIGVIHLLDIIVT